MPKPKLSNDFEELLVLGPFEGLDTTTGAYFLQGSKSVAQSNIVPDRRYESYITVQGRVAYTTLNSALVAYYGQCYGLAKFPSTYFGVPTTHVMVCYSSALGRPNILLVSTASGYSHPVGGSAANGYYWQFCTYQQNNAPSIPTGWLFGSNGFDPPIKIASATTGDETIGWNYTAPTFVPTVNVGGAGLISSANPYYYRCTYTDGVAETSPGPVSAAVTATSNTIGITVPITAITTNIYRLGGSLSTWIYVGSCVTSTTLFTDNIPDSAMTGASMVLHRDYPANFLALESHKERIWGFGYNVPYAWQFNSITNAFVTTGPAPSDLWYSNYGEPWGFDNTNQVIPVGRNAGTDNAVGLATLGSLLVCFKNKTTWAVYGDTQADFLARRLFDIGCASARSIIKAYGMVFWVSDRGIFSFDGADAPTNISRDIKATLDTFSQTDLNNAVGFCHYRQVYFSFPTTFATYGYDLDTQRWHQLSFYADNVTFDPENMNQVDATRPNTCYLDSWFGADTDLGNPINSSFTSRIADSGSLVGTKQYRYAVIEAPQQFSASVTINVVINPGGNQQYFTATVDLSTYPLRHLISLPPNMVGFEAQITISVSSSQMTEIQRVSLLGYLKRQLVMTG